MSQQLQITGGAKVRDLQDVIIGTSGVLSSLAFNVANGVPKLDVNGKILVSQLPNSVMEYKGTWDASTNTPTLVNGTGNQGDVYLCNVAGTTNFGAGPITFAVGDSAIYSGTIWQRAGGATGTVTSVGLTSTGNDAITITGSPVTTSGNINLGFAGTNLQYINGAGDLTTFPTLISSIGLSMPSAFSVANSPLTSNGTIAVTGAGYPSQYIRGDGTLADFPTSGGGGSSVSYYLNGGTSQGTIGGVTYYEMSKTADTGTMADFSLTGNGFIVAFLTDAGDPAQLNIPAGNWNYEIYASMSANGGTPEMYAELYKYDGTTFTLISTSSNEILYDGTNLNLYTFAMTVPATTLAITDRLAIKLYATNSGGKTTTVHTQDSHLCQIITTFSTGITALNGLTAQVQYFATGTSGTDFNISSSTATHTFNLPVASATNTGKLSSTDWSTFNGKVPYTGASANVDLGNFNFDANNISGGAIIAKLNGPASSPFVLKSGSSGYTIGDDAISLISSPNVANTLILASNIGIVTKTALIGLGSLTANRTYTLPDASGTLALLSADQTFTGINSFDYGINYKTGASLANVSGYISQAYAKSGTGAGSTLSLKISDGNSVKAINLDFVGNPATYTYTFPDFSGTVALTSQLGSYLPLAGGIMTGSILLNNNIDISGQLFGTSSYASMLAMSPSDKVLIDNSGRGVIFGGTIGQGAYTYTFPSASGTLALTSNLSAYLPLTGGTLTGILNGTTAAFSDSGTSTNTNLISLLQPNLTAYNGPILTLGKAIAINNAASIQFYYTSSGSSSNSLTLALYGSTGLTIYGNGNGSIAGSFGIGTTSPSYTLDVSGTGRFTGNVGVGSGTLNSYTGYSVLTINNSTTGSVLDLNRNGVRTGTFYADTSGVGIGSLTGSNLDIFTGNSYIDFQTNGAERMRITSTGNVGIGTTNPSDILDVQKNQNATTNFNFRNTDTTNTTSRANLNISSGNVALSLLCINNDHSYINATNNIYFQSGGSVKMTMLSSGNVGINTIDGGVQLAVKSTSTTSSSYPLFLFNSAGAGKFYVRSDGETYISSLGTGAVTATGGVVSTTSDMNLKIEDGFIDNALDKVLKLTPRYFLWKEESGLPTDLRQLGFYAQEVNEALGEEVANTPKDEDGKWGIYDRGMIAMLTKAMQEQNEVIEDLKARLVNAGL